MVQVDVFWGYGWGASLAVAAGRQLARAEKPYETRYHASTILFLALSWAPTGLLLLIRHPSWETMQVARDFAHIPAWLALAFGITNVTQGLLGFWIGHRLMARGRYYAAQLNWIFGYFGMFFILLYGWDGLGYDRFLYDRDMLPGSPAWTAGVGTAAGVIPAIVAFLTSSVAVTLYIDGLWLLPPFALLFDRWHREGARLAKVAEPGRGAMAASYLFGVFGVGFAAAAVCALVTRGVAYALGVPDHVTRIMQGPASIGAHALAYFIGLPVGLAIVWFGWVRPGMPGHRLLKPIRLTEDIPTDCCPGRPPAIDAGLSHAGYNCLTVYTVILGHSITIGSIGRWGTRRCGTRRGAGDRRHRSRFSAPRDAACRSERCGVAHCGELR